MFGHLAFCLISILCCIFVFYIDYRNKTFLAATSSMSARVDFEIKTVLSDKV